MASDLAGSDCEVQATLAKELAETRAAMPPKHQAAHARRNEYLAQPDALANDPVPNKTGFGGSNQLLLHESPEHREVVLLRLAGYSQHEIAAQTGYNRATVSIILRQPWARQRILAHLQEKHANLFEYIEREAAQSLVTLVELRDDPNTPASVRSSNCNSILDRYMGKAPQTVNVNKANVPATAEDAERRLAALRAEEARLRGN